MINQPVQLMTMVRRREASNAHGPERWSGKEDEAKRNPKRIGGKWMSSAIRNLTDERIYACQLSKDYIYLLISLNVPILASFGLVPKTSWARLEFAKRRETENWAICLPRLTHDASSSSSSVDSPCSGSGCLSGVRRRPSVCGTVSSRPSSRLSSSGGNSAKELYDYLWTQTYHISFDQTVVIG